MLRAELRRAAEDRERLSAQVALPRLWPEQPPRPRPPFVLSASPSCSPCLDETSLAQVAALTSKLHEERARTEAAAEGILAAERRVLHAA